GCQLEVTTGFASPFLEQDELRSCERLANRRQFLLEGPEMGPFDHLLGQHLMQLSQSMTRQLQCPAELHGITETLFDRSDRLPSGSTESGLLLDDVSRARVDRLIVIEKIALESIPERPRAKNDRVARFGVAGFQPGL